MIAGWDGINRVRGYDDLPEGLLREKDIKLHARLDMINRMAIELSSIPLDQDPYKPIVDMVRDITEARVVSVSKFDNNTLELVGVSTSGKILKLANSILGGNAIGMKMPVEDEIKNMMLYDTAGYSKDLHEVSFHTIPKPVSSTMQNLLGLRIFIGIALKYGDELLGTLMIVQGKETPPLNLKVAQVIANVCSIVLKRRSIETSLLKAEARYRDLFQTSKDAIFITTHEGNILDFNPSMKELLGYSDEELKRIYVPNLYADPEARNFFSEKMEQEGFVKDYQVNLIKKNGSLIESQITANRRILDNGTRVYQGIIRDISAQRKAQAALLEERNRAELYFDLLGHDIGNIHQGLLGTIFYAKRDLDNTGRLETALTSAEELLKRSVTLVSNVRLMARMRSGEANPAWMDIIPILDETLEDMKNLFKGRNITTRLKLETDRAEVFVEPMVKEIFFNLLHNAVKVQAGEEIILEVTVRKDAGSHVLILIEDHGPGIPDEQKDVILNIEDKSFRKLRTGLGLSIVKALVERYNGTIAVRDRIEGDYTGGARFEITFPSRPILTP